MIYILQKAKLSTEISLLDQEEKKNTRGTIISKFKDFFNKDIFFLLNVDQNYPFYEILKNFT